MRHILHIITKPDDALAQAIIEQQRRAPNRKTETVDLTQKNPSYDELVTKIFDADSIEVW